MMIKLLKFENIRSWQCAGCSQRPEQPAAAVQPTVECCLSLPEQRAKWELWFAATSQHHQNVLSLVLKEIQIQNSRGESSSQGRSAYDSFNYIKNGQWLQWLPGLKQKDVKQSFCFKWNNHSALSVMLTWHLLAIYTDKVMGKTLSVLTKSEPSTLAGYTSIYVQARITLIHSLYTINLYWGPTLYPEM